MEFQFQFHPINFLISIKLRSVVEVSSKSFTLLHCKCMARYVTQQLFLEADKLALKTEKFFRTSIDI